MFIIMHSSTFHFNTQTMLTIFLAQENIAFNLLGLNLLKLINLVVIFLIIEEDNIIGQSVGKLLVNQREPTMLRFNNNFNN